MILFISLSMHGRSSIGAAKSLWGVPYNYTKDIPEHRASVSPPFVANLMRIRRFNFAFDADGSGSTNCACHSYARSCFGFCRRRRRLSDQVDINGTII